MEIYTFVVVLKNEDTTPDQLVIVQAGEVAARTATEARRIAMREVTRNEQDMQSGYRLIRLTTELKK